MGVGRISVMVGTLVFLSLWLFSASNALGQWSIETVDNPGSLGTTSLALDGSGDPAISYRDRTNGFLKYAKWNGTSWDIETVDSTGDVGLVHLSGP